MSFLPVMNVWVSSGIGEDAALPRAVADLVPVDGEIGIGVEAGLDVPAAGGVDGERGLGEPRVPRHGERNEVVQAGPVREGRGLGMRGGDDFRTRGSAGRRSPSRVSVTVECLRQVCVAASARC